MMSRILGALAVGMVLGSAAQAQVITYYQPAAVPVVPQTTYYAPAMAAPAATYYAPAVTAYYAAPVTPRRVAVYHSSVSSMPVGSVTAAAPVVAAAPVPVGAPAVATLAPPVITYRPVVAAPSSYIVTRGLFGRQRLYPATPAVVPVIVP